MRTRTEIGGVMQILVSTVNARFDPVRAGVDPNVCVVVNQLVSEGGDETTCKCYDRATAEGFAVLEECREQGVSRSRNRAIDLASAEICLLADDDQVHVPDACDRVAAAFSRFPEADIITFMEKTALDGVLRKPYPRQSRPHSMLSVWRVRAPEIAFRRSRVLEAGLYFDPAFGPGSRYISADEAIFLTDAFRKGLKPIFVPEVTAFHPMNSTAQRGASDPNVMYSKGAAMKRLYGGLAPLAIFAFAGKKMMQRRTLSPILLHQMFRAWVDYGDQEKETGAGTEDL